MGSRLSSSRATNDALSYRWARSSATSRAFGDDSDLDSSNSLSLSDSSSLSDDKYGCCAAAGDGYDGSAYSDLKQRKAERKAKKKRKNKENAHRCARERERMYALYTTYITPCD
jgi:hypothetical protein